MEVDVNRNKLREIIKYARSGILSIDPEVKLLYCRDCGKRENTSDGSIYHENDCIIHTIEKLLRIIKEE